MSVIRSMKKVFRLGLAALAIGLAGCTPLEIVGVGAAACVIDCAPVKRLYDETANGFVDSVVAVGSEVKRGFSEGYEDLLDSGGPQDTYWAAKTKDDLVVIYGRSSPTRRLVAISDRARIHAARIGYNRGFEAFQVIYENADETHRASMDPGLLPGGGPLSHTVAGWADDAFYRRDFNYRLIVRLIKRDSPRLASVSFNIEEFLITSSVGTK